MPEYPDNSHSGREAASPPEKKVGKVVTGTAKTRKKSGAQKFAGAFLPEDVTSVKSYILRDVVVPGIKNAIADVVSIMLFDVIFFRTERYSDYGVPMFQIEHHYFSSYD